MTRSDNTSADRPLRAFYVAALVVCILLRALYVVQSDASSLYTQWSTAGDAEVYDRFGWNLVAHGTLGVGNQPSGFAMPAYPLFLAGIYCVAGHLPGAARWVQILLGVVTIVALGQFARILGGPRARVLAVAIGAIYPFFIYFTGEILTETLFLAAYSGMILTAARLGERGRPLDGVLHGLCLALTFLTRPVGLFLEPAALILARPWSPVNRRSRLAGLGIGFLLFGLAWGSWIARNRSALGETVLLDTHSGMALYLGHLESIGMSQEEIGRRLWYGHADVARGNLPGGPAGELDANRRAGELARQSMRADPGRFLRSVARNIARIWLYLNFSDMGSPTGTVGLATLVGWASYAPVLLLAGAGLVRLRRLRSHAFTAILALFAISSLVHGIFIGGQRYRVGTLDPLLIVLAALALDQWLGRFPRIRRLTGEEHPS
jgi:hypothetical protein